MSTITPYTPKIERLKQLGYPPDDAVKLTAFLSRTPPAA